MEKILLRSELHASSCYVWKIFFILGPYPAQNFFRNRIVRTYNVFFNKNNLKNTVSEEEVLEQFLVEFVGKLLMGCRKEFVKCISTRIKEQNQGWFDKSLPYELQIDF